MKKAIFWILIIFSSLFAEIEGKYISSGEISLEYGQPTEIFIAITNDNGILSITTDNPMQCKVIVRNSKGKILGNLPYNKLEIPVKKQHTYYIYAKAKSKFCDGFDIFIP